MPLITSGSVAPDGVSTDTGEPRCRRCAWAYLLDTKAPSAPRRAGVPGPPAPQLTLITWPTLGSTAVTLILEPKARPSPARTPDTTWTPGTVPNASAEATLIGVKLL